MKSGLWFVRRYRAEQRARAWRFGLLLVFALVAAAVAVAQVARRWDLAPGDPRAMLRRPAPAAVVYGCRNCGSVQGILGNDYWIKFGPEVVVVERCPGCGRDE